MHENVWYSALDYTWNEMSFRMPAFNLVLFFQIVLWLTIRSPIKCTGCTGMSEKISRRKNLVASFCRLLRSAGAYRNIDFIPASLLLHWVFLFRKFFIKILVDSNASLVRYQIAPKVVSYKIWRVSIGPFHRVSFMSTRIEKEKPTL